MRHGLATLLAILCWTPLLSPLPAQSIGSVGRSTSDRDADLIEALIERARYEDALAVCRMSLRDVSPDSEASAKWAIRQSRVLVAAQMEQERMEEADVELAARPVTGLLEAYPDHPRRWFLLAQSAMVERSNAWHLVLRAAISPADNDLRDLATAKLLRVTELLETLVEQVNEARIVLDQSNADRSRGQIEDLNRLQQELQVELVSLALMQTELFATGSDDAIAAATRAERMADQAIARLPVDTKARMEVERLKVESIFRAGQYDRADQQLASWLPREDAPVSPRWRSLQIRLDIAQQRMQQAGARLREYYGDRPVAAPRSTEMDLAKLEYLLRTGGGGASEWLDTIQQRGGAYARRRAEASALSLLARSKSTTQPAVDPAMVAAQGQDYLRRGNPARGAELLAAAAAAETDADRAVSRAIEAAAAFGLAERHEEAASVLAEIALAHPEAEQAPMAHLQAAFLLATHQPQAVATIESTLRLHLKRWPAAETAASTRTWLQNLLTSQQRYLDAAEVVTVVPIDQLTPEIIDRLTAAWRLVLREASEPSSEVSQRFLTVYQPLLADSLAAQRFPLLAALLVDRDQLAVVDSLNAKRGAVEADPFSLALLAFRRRGEDSEVLHTPPPALIADATTRLMRDGRQNPSLRQSIAKLLGHWEGTQSPSLDQVERLLWSGQVDASIKLVSELIQAQPGSVEMTRNAARLLQESGDRRAIGEAVRLWDQLAAGTSQGSSLWHEAKLAAITALRRNGNLEEARRRAKYVLLTAPKMEDALRQQYDALSQ